MAKISGETAVSHIVIDARESGTTSGRYVDKLIEYLYKLPSEHDFTLLAKPHRIDYLHTIAPAFALIETKHKEFSLAEQFGLLSQINAMHADLVHFPMPQQPAFYAGPVVTTIQDLTTVRFRNPAKNPLVFWAKQQVYKWLIRRVAHKSKQLIAISEFVKHDVADFAHVSPDKITVTLEAADLMPEGSTPVTRLEGKQFIMYVGRPTPHKNLARLIDAFVELQASHPDLVLVLAGKKDYNYHQHEVRVQEDGIKGVIFTDFIPDEKLRWLYEHCAAYVFPSLSEGFGLPGLEAMIHGAPVVSSNATCLPEVHGDAAHYFDPLDVHDMATKITDVIDNESLRADLITKGKARAATFSWERMATQTLAVYDKALAKS